ncbi:MAG: hypothetical protein JSR97_02995 [Verrucomicrobia bacterium]|nr:hypothetical protein [Verrucomicrobiota bacterium]
MQRLFLSFLSSHELHAKWLNTLSYLENCGARKIAACEHPTLVKEEMLKHAAEEFRHAHHLKRQITRIFHLPMPSYLPSCLLGGSSTLNYLNALDIKTSRYLAKSGFSKSKVKEIAYLLVTYAIELRAEELYPLYQSALREAQSPISVKSILLEEKEHLNEMREGLARLPSGFLYAEHVCSFESQLCEKWLLAITKELSNSLPPSPESF